MTPQRVYVERTDPVLEYFLKDELATHFKREAARLTRLFFGDKRPLPTGAEISKALTFTVTRNEPRFWRSLAERFSRYKPPQDILARYRCPHYVPDKPAPDILKHNYSMGLEAYFCLGVGHTLPTTELINAVVDAVTLPNDYVPLVEVGAGPGLLNRYIESRLPTFFATDDGSQPFLHPMGFVEGLDGRDAVKKYQKLFVRMGYENMAVLMGHPPVQASASGVQMYSKSSTAMPLDVLHLMRPGDLLLYVGKYRGQETMDIVATASPDFHDYLDNDFEAQRPPLPLYSWFHGETPDLMIYKKQGPVKALGE